MMKLHIQTCKGSPLVRNSQPLNICNTFPVVDGRGLFRYPVTTARHWSLYSSVQLQQSGTDGHAEAQPCSPQLQHKKECSENLLTKENLMLTKKLQILDELTLQARIEGLTDHFHRQIVGVSLTSMQVYISKVI